MNGKSQMKRLLAHRYVPVVLAGSAIMIMLGSLRAGLIMDDLVQRAVLVEPSELPERLYETGHVPDNAGQLSAAVFNQFGFSRNAENMNKYRNYGLVPWWSHENLKASLWRPLTAMTHWIDYQLFPDRPAFMHAHNIIWFAAVVFLAGLLYRQFLPAWLAGLAALLFLLDKNSYFPVMFIACRGYFVAMFFAILTLLAHHRWRTHGSPRAAVVAQIFLLASLLSNEAGVTTFAYLLAYALTLERASWRDRIMSLVPAVSVIVGWRIIYNLLGYGVYGAGLYIDPYQEPFGYISAILERIPIILIGQLGGQSPELFHAVSDSVKIRVWFLSVAFVVIVFIVLFALVRRNRNMRFWFLAMIFSVLPISTVAAMSKNLPFVAIAAFGSTNNLHNIYHCPYPRGNCGTNRSDEDDRFCA
jgi:hypothetical protein